MFGETTLEPLEKRRDKELTLGPTTLLLLALGLFGLCGVCFVFGYAVGQHGAPVSPAAGAQLSAAGSGSTPQTSASSVKPAPSQNSFQAKQTAAPAADTSAATSPGANSESDQPAHSPSKAPAQPAPSTASAAPPRPQAPAPSVIPAALPGKSETPQPALVSGPIVRPALPQSTPQPGAWMVQIAAVSHPEDADVLVSALRKNGYAVAVHRDLSDSLIHVQVGPFASRSDALVMRQKLLNDGYNAIVQP